MTFKLLTSAHQVQATDKDTGSNQRVTYRLTQSAASIFEINSDSGEIYTKVKLDRERVDKYTFVVEAVDHGEPQRTGSSLVVVNVSDKNDNPPRFTRLFSVNVTENAPIGTSVIQVCAKMTATPPAEHFYLVPLFTRSHIVRVTSQVTSSDKDIGANGNATYSFTENPGGKFSIDGSSGNVTVAGHIDREARHEYALKVSAVDGSWRAETPLTITVCSPMTILVRNSSHRFRIGFPSYVL